MQLSYAKMTQTNSTKDIIRVVLDEPRLYVEESLGSVMVRGEVIVNFPKDTHIQGPIDLIFEGIQRFQTWPEIMRGALGSPIETVLQVVELSLLPPNSKGIMPAGVQRFPFEFPIPSTLPTTVFIRDRMEIFYQVCATIRKSKQLEHQDAMKPANWIGWARRNNGRKKYVACSPMRIVRAMESISHHILPISNNSSQASIQSLSLSPTLSSASSSVTTPIVDSLTQNLLPWNRRGLSEYQGTLDEQHDQLAFSLSGRTSSNLTQPINSLDCVQGIRYKIAMDRTAIALGTSIGIELMIEPTIADVTIKSVTLNISENRKYAMKVPSDHNGSSAVPKIKKATEGAKMVLKWAYGYEVENEDGEIIMDKKEACYHDDKTGNRYVRKRSSSSKFLAYFDPPQPGNPNNKYFLGNYAFRSDIKPENTLDSAEEEVQENEDVDGNSSSSSKANNNGCDMINLKELNQTVKLGEYFGGRFVMPVPDCSNILHPSMDYESITIIHWLQLAVIVECNGKTSNLLLDSPSRILDCRVVSVDDDCQTILPPPPSYQPGDGHLYQENYWATCNTFWEQREAITSVSGWGHCVPCPCQYKKMKQVTKETQGTTTTVSSMGNKKSPTTTNSNIAVIGICPPNLLPEWGPPPSYSEN